MTTFVLPPLAADPTEDALDDLDDFMADLDKDLKAEAAKAKRAAASARKEKPKAVWQDLPVVVPAWTPTATILFSTRQHCTNCHSEFLSVDGVYLEDHTRNGARRTTRLTEATIPATYADLPRKAEDTLTTIPVCPCCFNQSVTSMEPSK